MTSFLSHTSRAVSRRPRVVRARASPATSTRTMPAIARAPATPATPRARERPSSSDDAPKTPERSTATSPIKGAPVRVPASVRSVYRRIDKKTFLDWGLTSDWSVDGPRKRRSIGGDGDRTEEASGAATAKRIKVETEEEDGNAASEGYGEMTEGSIEKLFLLLRELSSAELDAPLPVRTPVKGESRVDAWSGLDLCEESTFIDVGSGYGKVVFHAALSAKVSKAVGIEYVPSRAQKASEVQAELMGETRALMTEEARELVSPPRCVLEQGDATTYGALNYTHIYMYDRVFNEKTLELLAKQLNRSKYRVLVTYQRVELWRRLGLRDFEHVHSFTMRTTGGQNFKAYVFVRLNA